MLKFINLIIISVLFISCNKDKSEADAFGNFESREHYVSSKAIGEIHNLNIEKGQFIEKGYVAGTVDTSLLVIQKNQLKAKGNSILTISYEIDAQVSLINTKLDNLNLNKNRLQVLVKNKASSQQKLDNIISEIEIAEGQIDQAKAKKKSILSEINVLNIQIELVDKQINDCKIINPVSGTILEKFVENHEFCVTGKPIYKIADLSHLELKAYVSAGQLSSIQIGQNVKVAIDGPDESLIYYDGEISWIASEAEFTPKIIQTSEDRLNLVYAIKVRVINDGKIKIGMPGEVYFEGIMK